jgi:hypothetical protein
VRGISAPPTTGMPKLVIPFGKFVKPMFCSPFSDAPVRPPQGI